MQETVTTVNSFTLSDLEITFELTVDNDVELSSASDGKVYYWNGSMAIEKSGAKAVGTYVVGSLAWADTYPSDQRIALAGDYTMAITPTTQVVLLKKAAASSVTANEATDDEFEFTVTEQGALQFKLDNDNDAVTITASTVTGKFAVRPAETSDSEATHSGDKITVAYTKA